MFTEGLQMIYDYYRIKAFLMGMYEFRNAFTTWYGDYGLQRAYDHGRDWAHAITLRRYE
jgi:hypothetical protein